MSVKLLLRKRGRADDGVDPAVDRTNPRTIERVAHPIGPNVQVSKHVLRLHVKRRHHRLVQAPSDPERRPRQAKRKLQVHHVHRLDDPGENRIVRTRDHELGLAVAPKRQDHTRHHTWAVGIGTHLPHLVAFSELRDYLASGDDAPSGTVAVNGVGDESNFQRVVVLH
jgi:hypothetical protein